MQAANGAENPPLSNALATVRHSVGGAVHREWKS
jgi:hypothetical protein